MRLVQRAHTSIPGRDVIEVLHEGRLIATITAHDQAGQAGIRVTSKYPMTPEFAPPKPPLPDMLIVSINPTEKPL